MTATVLRESHSASDPHAAAVLADQATAATITLSAPNTRTSLPSNSRRHQAGTDVQSRPVSAGHTSSRGQRLHGDQRISASAGSDSDAARGPDIHAARAASDKPGTQAIACAETHSSIACVPSDSASSDTRHRTAVHIAPVPLLADPTLALFADVLDDAERNRIGNENRLRTLTTEHGLAGTPEAAQLEGLVQALAAIEHGAELALRRQMRKHPLNAFRAAHPGMGEKQFGRFLSAIGDPYVNSATGQPRTVGQLRAYCGHGDPTRKLAKGASQADLFALGNPTAKKRLWLLAQKVWMVGTRDGQPTNNLAAVGHARKADTEGRLHTTPCRRCGPAGHPAQPGTPWSDAHRHADALRVLGKEILRQLWIAARDLHEGAAS